ncbi:hypothetical protein AVEN_178072-1, partial [Araneus ventricosus]
YVVKFLSKLLENVDTNKMSSQNIAIVMAPNLIWSPTEDSSTLGMNMSTASLHTSIIETLISYCDWFFPESEDGSCCVIPSLASNEVNGNLQVNGMDPCPSPRSPHKNLKKPTAPLPPAPKMTDDPVGELIDLTDNTSPKECTSASDEAKETVIPIEVLQHPNENVIPIEVLRRPNENVIPIEVLRRPNENVISLSGEAVAFRPEKPAIPDKPSYSSCSLDRKSLRQSVNNPRLSRTSGNRAADPMTRSHIERPSVPPPERPVKGSKFSSSENLTSLAEHVKQTKVDSDDQPRDLAENSSAAGLQHSRSTSKMNRFDFLVNQKEEKPPERPPRLTAASGEPSESKSESGQASSSPLPVSPRSGEVEKSKPPRPQPPVPVKPKQLVQNENTNL